MIKKIITAVALATSLVSNIQAKDLTVTPYNPGVNAIFPVTSTIITGEKEAILVDAQFQKQYAQQLIKQIKQTGKELSYIYISHSDPDFYFGADEILKAFPKAKLVSSAQTAYLINATKDAKLQVWNASLKADVPSKLLVPQALTTDKLVLDGKEIQIKQLTPGAAQSYLWLPSQKTIIGSIAVNQGGHLWMADTDGVNGIDKWLATIDSMIKLKPQKVIPSHYITSDFSPNVLTFTKQYLTKYKQALSNAKNSADIANELQKSYPEFKELDTLIMGAKVLKQEIDWHVATPFPAMQQKLKVKLAKEKYTLDFINNLQVKVKQGRKNYISNYSINELPNKQFAITWQNVNGVKQEQILDFSNNTIVNAQKQQGRFKLVK